MPGLCFFLFAFNPHLVLVPARAPSFVRLSPSSRSGDSGGGPIGVVATFPARMTFDPLRLEITRSLPFFHLPPPAT